MHVDGAFGLWAAVSPLYAPLLAGAGSADSWAIDCHKWLNVPYDSGVAVVRTPENLHTAMTLSAAYLTTGDGREPWHYAPEASRRARGVELWAAMRSLGRSGLRELIERNCRQAKVFAERLHTGGVHHPERRGPEPGAGLVRQRGGHAEGHHRYPERWDLLVWGNAVARAYGDANQRVQLGHHR